MASRADRRSVDADDRIAGAHWLVRYGLALSLSAMAFGLTAALRDTLDSSYLLLAYFPAVALTAWLAGFGPGLLASVAAIFTTGYLFLPPVDEFHLRAIRDGAGLASFFVVTGLISGIATRLRAERTLSYEDRSEAASHDAAEREARAAAEAAAHRLDIVARAGRVLGSSLDVEETLHSAVDLLVDSVADYAVTYLAGDDDRLRRIAWSHVDPDKMPILNGLEPGHPVVGDRVPVRTAVISGKTVHVVDPTGESIVANALSSEHARLVRALEPRSVIVTPLRVRGRTIGALSVATVAGGKPLLGDQDVPLIEKVASRCALAVDNARLYHSAARASRAKSEFLTVMSHELRTPLNAILGFSNLLIEGIVGPVNDRQKEQLDRILASGRHLLELIDQILHLSRIEAGRTQIEYSRFDGVALARDAAEIVRPLAEEKGVDLRVDLPGACVEMRSDPGKIRQILLNLLGNAIKFTDDGQVRLWLSATDDEVSVGVCDTGPGIPAQDRERIFEPFTQLDRDRDRRSGTGLGLSVSREYARLLGGDLKVGDAAGAGATFLVRLPRGRSSGTAR